MIGDSIENARIQIRIQRKMVMKGWKMMLATFSMLHLNSKHPKDLVTAIAAIVRKSAYAIQFRSIAEYLQRTNIYFYMNDVLVFNFLFVLPAK